MQADLKTLNLKKTFSFLQNLDYNEDDGNTLMMGNDHNNRMENNIIDRKKKKNHADIHNDYDLDED